jgi:hypothetical protein
MKITASLAKALIQSSKDTANFMTAELRNEALNSGWDPSVANSLRVVFSKNKFVVKYPDKHKTAVTNLEYGTPSTQPTAAIRRFSNRLEESEKFFMKRSGTLLKGMR